MKVLLIVFFYIVLSCPQLLSEHISTKKIVWAPTKQGDTISIEADEGYFISAKITKCNFNEKEYGVIKTGDELSKDDGLLFAHSVKSTPSYLFYTNEVFGLFTATDLSSFEVVFERFGVLTTTTEVPTTTDNGLPKPDDTVEANYTVYIYGKTAVDYENEEIMTIFTQAVVGMATEYCTVEIFPLLEKITQNNILIDTLVECPYNWPHSDICVKIIFEVPIALDDTVESKWTGYQLIRPHLKIMWDRYAEKYLNGDLSIYPEPDVDNIVKYWAIAIALVISIFIILLIVLRYCSVRLFNIRRKSKMSDRRSIISHQTRDDDLTQHYLQATPSFFEDELNNTYSEPYDGPLPVFKGVEPSLIEDLDNEESGA